MARDCRAESQLYICRMECDVVWIGSEEDGQCYYCAIRFAALLAVWRSCLPWRATACVLFVSLIDWKVGRGRVSFERAEKRMDDKLSPSPCFSSFCAVSIFFTTIVFFVEGLRTAEWLVDVLSSIVLGPRVVDIIHRQNQKDGMETMV